VELRERRLIFRGDRDCIDLVACLAHLAE
jgi:hypothetical protein